MEGPAASPHPVGMEEPMRTTRMLWPAFAAAVALGSSGCGDESSSGVYGPNTARDDDWGDDSSERPRNRAILLTVSACHDALDSPVAF